MKYVILLNRKFPFKTGEAFLENEINEIAKYFDKILIYPSDVKNGEPRTRKIISKNVDIRIIEKQDFKTRKMHYLFGSIKYIAKCKDAKSLRNKLIEAYFLSAAYSQAKKIIKDLQKLSIKKSDEIYLYSYWLYINAKAACIIRNRLRSEGYNVVAFSRAHAFDIYEEKRKYSFLPQQETLIKDLNIVFPCSENGTKYLAKRYPQYKNKIKTSYLGTYDHGVRTPKPHRSFNIFSCSRMGASKRVDLIVDALSKLKNENLNLSWTHIGGGKQFNEIEQAASEQLSWMKASLLGQKSNLEVYNYYLDNDIDLFLNTSYSEGLPVSIMEATSFGIPVIATNVGGTSEIVIDGRNGFILPESFNSRQLANAIKCIAKMSEQDKKAMQKQSRQIWEKNFEATKNYQNFASNILKHNRGCK